MGPKYISNEDIQKLDISPATCVEWVRESFLIKKECQLPKKIPVHPQGDDFITTMPCLLPEEMHRFGVKVVSRTEGRHPALKSSLTLYDTISGDAIALMDADWITNMRTGAVATLAIKTLRKPDSKVYSFIGLGQIARATLKCLADVTTDEVLTIRLKRYKDQAERFAEEFSHHTNLTFEIVDDMRSLVQGADVVVSAITSAKEMLVEDVNWFEPGVLLVPIHTRGFQNCDTVFDHVFGDDYDHIKGFQYFDQFKAFDELGEVLRGEKQGRTSSEERIIAYNYGLALHDVYFAAKLYKLVF
ncbi:MAG: ornithine cyclodeaminase [Clostridium sp.]|nr:ornithine cyclodeaminase [Bacteroidales bacterium]MCC8087192.1 ornithine cyclodeaminase [Clostridium sp.]